MTRRLLSCLLAIAALPGCAYFQGVYGHPQRAVLLSLDGGGQRVIDHLIADGAMPNLARLRAGGVTAAYSRTNFPSKTAAGHAALWTGAYGDVNGVTSNKVFALPLADHAITEVTDGFDSQELLAEPLWVTAARCGKRAVVLQATQVAPVSTYMAGGRFGGPYKGTLTLFDDFSSVVEKEAVYHAAPLAHLAFGRYEVVARARGATVSLALSEAAKPLATLAPGQAAWSGPLTFQTSEGPAQCAFHLFKLGAGYGLYRTPLVLVQANRPAAEARVFAGTAAVPQGGLASWAKGDFGATMYKGGDGGAEEAYLETVEYSLAQSVARTRAIYRRHDWDLLVSYLPFPDEMLHGWYGTVDDQSPTYDPAMAPHVWKLLDRVGRACDRYIGELAAPDTAIAVGSDHGMAGLAWKFFPNTVLRQAGLLAVTEDGHVDLAHTLAFYPATDAAFIVVNRVGRKGGIVPAGQVDAVVARVQEALREVKAQDGTPLVTGFTLPGSEPELGVGGIRGGDLYFDLHKGYYYNPDFNQPVVVAPLDRGQGGHVFDPRREDMHATLTLWGPGVRRGVTIGAVRNTDVAPTLLHLLGLPAPAQATGRVLTEALVDGR